MITDRFIKSKKNLCSVSNNKELQKRCCTKLFDGFFDTIQAFFPFADKRKVAKVTIEQGYSGFWFNASLLNGNFSSSVYTSDKSTLRGARIFCRAIGYEMEVVK